MNSYDILEVSPSASISEIQAAVAKAMKSRKHSVKAIAEAQKALRDPQQRIIADFLLPVLPTAKRLKRSDYSCLEQEPPQIKYLEQFDGLDEEILRTYADEY
jgi:hypothetical protein